MYRRLLGYLYILLLRRLYGNMYRNLRGDLCG